MDYRVMVDLAEEYNDGTIVMLNPTQDEYELAKATCLSFRCDSCGREPIEVYSYYDGYYPADVFEPEFGCDCWSLESDDYSDLYSEEV